MIELPKLKVGDTFQCVNGVKRTIIVDETKYACIDNSFKIKTEWYDSIEELMKQYDGKFLTVIDFL